MKSNKALNIKALAKKSVRFTIAFAMTFFALTFLIPGTSHAQITKTAHIELNDINKPAYIGPYLYTTQDPEENIDYRTIITRHQNNLRGTRQNNSLINFGLKTPPTWMVLSVTNNTDNESWVLHFGDATDGRFGLARKLLVRNNATGETFVQALRQKDTPNAFGENLQGPAVAIKIRPKQTDLFVIYMEAEGGLPNTFKPKLMSEKSYINNLRFGDFWHILLNLFFISAIGTFIAISLLNKNVKYLIFCGYYLINACLFWVIDNSFFASFSVIGEVNAVLYMLSAAASIVITKIFSDISVEDYTANTIMASISGIIALAALFSAFFFDERSILDDILILTPPLLAFLTMAVLSFSQGQKGNLSAHYYAAAWLIVFIGGLIMSLSAAGVLPSNTILMNAYLLSLFPQAFFFISGIKKEQELAAQEKLYQRSREERAVHSLARLQQSKESADQARLLRVIERERELMGDLREREMLRAEEMKQAKDVADAANRAKSAFLAVVSHEIRTPMTGILGMVRLLMDTQLNKEQADYSLAIQQSGDTMMALLNDILDFEKIESGNMQLEDIEFDFPRLVQDVITLMSGHATGKNITLKADIPENFPHTLIGDPTRLRQIILNLVNNAIKFTEIGGVTIHLKAVELLKKPEDIDENYEIYVGVEDTGIGISEEAQEDLFNPFSQADKSVSRRYGGTGLGLAICKRLIESMGSGISLQSQEGHGSTFSFNLLMHGEQEASERTQDMIEAQHITLPPMHILVVEDNEMNRRVLEGFLNNIQQKSTLCASGEEALTVLETQDFDAVFMDISLQGMDGFETTREIRRLNDPKKSRLPIIAITGNVSPEDIEDCYKNSMNGFIPKPIDPENVKNMLIAVHTDQLENPIPDMPKEVRQTAPPPKTPAQNPAAPLAPGTKELSPIQQYMQEQEQEAATAPADGDEDDSFNNAILEPENNTIEISLQGDEDEDTNDIINTQMLNGLIDNLGKEQFIDLIRGFFDKADEIINALTTLKDAENITAIMARAHELKGMAGNFGMSEMSTSADIIEEAAKNKDIQPALREIERLPKINQGAKLAIQKWLDSLNEAG